MPLRRFRFRCGLCLINYAAVALGIHVVPLLPHHRVLERQRKERQLTGAAVDELQIDPLYQGIGVRAVFTPFLFRLAFLF